MHVQDNHHPAQLRIDYLSQRLAGIHQSMTELQPHQELLDMPADIYSKLGESITINLSIGSSKCTYLIRKVT